MIDEAALAAAEPSIYPFALGSKVRFDLASPCVQIVDGLQCLSSEGYIELVPFQSSYDFKQSCAGGHYVQHVKRAEVELLLGVGGASGGKTVVRDLLSPSRRMDLYVILRDQSACVYCGRRPREAGLDEKPITVSADHIIPKALIDPADIRRDGELLRFARDIQLVTTCQSHNSVKQHGLLPLESARDLFVRHVLKNDIRGPNLGLLSTFERLYRLAERKERLGKRERPSTS